MFDIFDMFGQFCHKWLVELWDLENRLLLIFLCGVALTRALGTQFKTQLRPVLYTHWALFVPGSECAIMGEHLLSLGSLLCSSRDLLKCLGLCFWVPCLARCGCGSSSLDAWCENLDSHLGLNLDLLIFSLSS